MDDEPAIEADVRRSVVGALGGTDYLPSGGCVVTDVVVVLGYVDADDQHGWSMVRAGSPWATRGLAIMAVDAMEADYTEPPD